MPYSKGCHTTFHHRYHLVRAWKYRHKVLIGDVRLSVHEIIRRAKGRSSRNIQQEFEHIRKRYWGQRF
jgi:putative transposase